MDFKTYLETAANGRGVNADRVLANPELCAAWQKEFQNFQAVKVTVTNFGNGCGVTAYGESRDSESRTEYQKMVEIKGPPTRQKSRDFCTTYYWDQIKQRVFSVCDHIVTY